jgi:thioredoxin 1
MKNLKSRDELTQILAKEDYVVLDFTASWCGPCQMMKPALEWIESSYPRVVIVTIDVDRFQKLYKEYSVSSIPDLRLMRKGEMVERFVGVPKMEEFRTALRKFLGLTDGFSLDGLHL